MVCKNWFFRPDWYYIGTILVCTKSKMTNRFRSAMSAEGPGAQFETVAKSREAKRESRTFVDVLDADVIDAFSVLVA